MIMVTRKAVEQIEPPPVGLIHQCACLKEQPPTFTFILHQATPKAAHKRIGAQRAAGSVRVTSAFEWPVLLSQCK